MASEPVPPIRKGHIGLIVAGSMFGGLILALVLTLLVFGGATEPIISGVALLAFALGWTMLGWLSDRRTDQPQRWAYVPATFMGVLGLAHLVFRPSDGVLRPFGWVWPIAAAGLAIWMIIQSRRSLHNWSRPVILYPFLAVLLLAAFGGGYETIREAMDESAYTMPGQLVDVGGHKLQISCTGSGDPTVILEVGLGQPAAMMSGWIQPGVATATRVCVYDRAGMGWSEPAETPRDGVSIAADLHTLLRRAEIDGPYVLAGHSSGGVYAQVFAAQYPDEVAGLVLLDSQPPDAIANLPGYAAEYDGIRRFTALFPSLARLGVGRLAYPSASGLPPEAWAEARALVLPQPQPGLSGRGRRARGRAHASPSPHEPGQQAGRRPHCGRRRSRRLAAVAREDGQPVDEQYATRHTGRHPRLADRGPGRFCELHPGHPRCR
jgi:pimeloyl-ACP methyl ester carboxylesterase